MSTSTAESSTLEKQENLKKEAFEVVSSTNDDGTIKGIISGKPYREEDSLMIEIHPCVPDSTPHVAELQWPKKDSTDYLAVQLAEQSVGGFQNVSSLDEENVKVDTRPHNKSIKLQPKDPEAECEEEWYLVIESNNESGSLIERINWSVLFFKSLPYLGYLSILSLIVVALLLPFGVSVFSLTQGISFLLLSLLYTVIAIGIQDKYTGDDEQWIEK